MLSTGGKDDQLVKVQKEILTNYYMQKYNTIMGNLHSQPTIKDDQISAHKQALNTTFSNRLNFKTMILNKKNAAIVQVRAASQSRSSTGALKEQKINPKNRKEQEIMSTYKTLERSIIRQMSGGSPLKIESGTFSRLLLKQKLNLCESCDLMPALQTKGPSALTHGNISSSYSYEPTTLNLQKLFPQHDLQESSPRQELMTIKEAIKNEFQKRLKGRFNPKKIATQNQYNPYQSEITEEGYAMNLQDIGQEGPYEDAEGEMVNKGADIIDRSEEGLLQMKNGQGRQVVDGKQYLSGEFMSDLRQKHQDIDREIVNDEIEFVPPSSSYYKNQHSNLVEDSFRFQQAPFQHHLNQLAPFPNHQHRDRPIQYKQNKIIDNSKLENSFVSRISKFSSQSGLKIKELIENQLYENQYGPYQSPLYNILEMIEKYPGMGSILKVAKKTLEDRKAFEDKRMKIQQQMLECRKKMQKSRKKRLLIDNLQAEQKQVRVQRLQIMRLIRKLATKEKHNH